MKEQANNRSKHEERAKGKVTHVNRPTRIPNTPAGQRCMDVLRFFAKKMWDAGNEATNSFIQSNFPEAKTISKEYADHKYKRTIEWGGEHITVIYDYETQAAMVG